MKQLFIVPLTVFCLLLILALTACKNYEKKSNVQTSKEIYQEQVIPQQKEPREVIEYQQEVNVPITRKEASKQAKAPETIEELLIMDDIEIEEVYFMEEEVAELDVRSSPKFKKTVEQPTSESRENYAKVSENSFKNPLNAPFSTFSIDVDAASYSNMRRFVQQGQKPPVNAVRIEEMINYFDYSYDQPTGEHPFNIEYELSDCPWNKSNQLLHIGLQGKKLDSKEAPASNLVFLIDVSGSMSDHNKLPLLKKAFKLLTDQLRPEDRVAIVVYAGSSGLVLSSTSGKEKDKIMKSLDKLHAGGSTAGAAGLQLAYKVAQDNYKEGGNNRIILATDGDFNVGQSTNSEMEDMIIKYREKNIFISVMGFGMYNYQDDKMELIADKGNGNYSYIDNLMEAKKVFINEFSSTLFTIAKDVKIQVEFNPAYVAEYRLVGYENRMLNEEDFADDKKDAGELGAGHTVTALYEIVPAGNKPGYTRDLKYQKDTKPADAVKNGELAQVKFRYKQPEGKTSQLLVQTVSAGQRSIESTSDNFRFSAAVAGFGMLLKGSDYIKDYSYDDVLKLARSSRAKDHFGYRSEFVQLVDMMKNL